MIATPFNNLDAVLAAWRTSFDAACKQVDRHRILGFPPSAIPNRAALLEATLSSLESTQRLVGVAQPYMRELLTKGVVAPNLPLAQLDTGTLTVIAAACPKLRQVLDLVDAMSERAMAASIGRANDTSPVLRAPSLVRAGRGTLVQIELLCMATSRVLIHSSGLDETRVIVQPDTHMILSMTHAQGELTVFAENDSGATKLVQALEIGLPPECHTIRSTFARAAQRVRLQPASQPQGVMA